MPPAQPSVAWLLPFSLAFYSLPVLGGGGYLLAAALMLVAAVVEAFFGIDAEGRSLEEIAEPLSAT